MRLEFEAYYISYSDLVTLSNQVAAAAVPEDFIPLPDTMVFFIDTKPVLDSNNSASWGIKILQQTTANLNYQNAARLVAGHPQNQAIEILLNQLPLQEKPKITLSPVWWPRLPFLAFRIETNDAIIQ